MRDALVWMRVSCSSTTDFNLSYSSSTCLISRPWCCFMVSPSSAILFNLLPHSNKCVLWSSWIWTCTLDILATISAYLVMLLSLSLMIWVCFSTWSWRSFMFCWIDATYFVNLSTYPFKSRIWVSLSCNSSCFNYIFSLNWSLRVFSESNYFYADSNLEYISLTLLSESLNIILFWSFRSANADSRFALRFFNSINSCDWLSRICYNTVRSPYLYCTSTLNFMMLLSKSLFIDSKSVTWTYRYDSLRSDNWRSWSLLSNSDLNYDTNNSTSTTPSRRWFRRSYHSSCWSRSPNCSWVHWFYSTPSIQNAYLQLTNTILKVHILLPWCRYVLISCS